MVLGVARTRSASTTETTNGGMNQSSNHTGNRTRSSASPSETVMKSPSSSAAAASSSTSTLFSCFYSSSGIFAGRIILFSCLLACAIVFGYFAHDVLKRHETELAVAHYEATVERALDMAEAITIRKTSGAKTMATIIRNRFPDPEQWPMVALDGYEEISTGLIASSSSDGRGVGFCPLVQSGQQALDFEDFAYNYFDRAFGLNHTVGQSSFGRGIYAEDEVHVDSADNRFLDQDGRPWDNEQGIYVENSPYRYLAPMLQHSRGSDIPVLMRNIRNDRSRGHSIDRMIDCVIRNDVEDGDEDCGVISSFVWSGEDLGAYIYQPVILPGTRNKLSGFIVSSIRWSDTLADIFTDHATGIDMVLSSGKETYTYRIEKGNATLVGEGDLHDSNYDSYKWCSVITEQAFSGVENDRYLLCAYPTDAMCEAHSTENPFVAAIGVGCVIVFTSFMFGVYDCLVSKNIREKGTLLDAKREFMRYVSHEVRTPLNTVTMGLQLLREDLYKAFDRKPDPGLSLNGSNHSLRSTVTETSRSGHRRRSTGRAQLQANQAAVLRLSEEILSSAHSAVGVLNDFLNYDKIESKSLQLDLSVLNIWKDLEHALVGFRLPAEAKRIQLQLDLSTLPETDEEQGAPSSVSELPTCVLQRRVIGDDARISQVFRNLLSNALKFTPKGGSITVQPKWIPPPIEKKDSKFTGTASFLRGNASLSKKLKGSFIKDNESNITLSSGKKVKVSELGKVQISITDTGTGMTQEQLNQVFAAGVQFNANALQKGQGSGLGMYIAKEIVAQHGGTLMAESEGIGKGTTFILTLPLYYIPDEALPESLQRLRVCPDQELANTEGQELSVNKSFEPLRILVVDDAATNRKLLRRLLERRGHVCDEARDGAEAVAKVLGDDSAKGEDSELPYFDTILMDFQMPIMSGPEAVKKLRAAGCDSFVVGITGNVLPEDIAHFKACGANEVLHKPVDLDVLGGLWIEYGISGSGNAKVADYR